MLLAYNKGANMFAISATVVVKDGKWSSVRQVPSFTVQACSEDNATRIARDIIDPAGLGLELHICAVRIS